MGINPVIFTIGGFGLHWYGVIVMLSIVTAAWLTGREVKRRGGNPDWVWDGLVYALVAGVVGARLWYVVNDILGGSTRYLDDPVSIVQIWMGGLHFYGAILFGGIAFVYYGLRNKLDVWLLLDSAAPYLLLGQGLARPVNYINQELYGPPTDLPWGIPIDATHRTIPPWDDLSRFPVETTRFHPTFAYEMIWNFAAAALLVWVSRRFEGKLRPGVLFFGWLVLAGVGRAIIEGFRPDQPVLPGTTLSYSRLVSLLMALVGVILILARYSIIRLKTR